MPYFASALGLACGLSSNRLRIRRSCGLKYKATAQRNEDQVESQNKKRQ